MFISSSSSPLLLVLIFLFVHFALAPPCFSYLLKNLMCIFVVAEVFQCCIECVTQYWLKKVLVYGCACECVYEFKHNFLCNAFASHTHSLLAISTTSSFWFHMQFQLACANVCAYSFLFVLWIFVYFIAVIIRCPVAVVVIIDCLLCFVFFVLSVSHVCVYVR